MRCRETIPRRRGSLVVEAAVSVALLATVTVGLAKLAQSSSRLHQQSDRRLAATLAAENVLERVREVPISTLDAEAKQAAQTVSDASPFRIDVSTTPFNAGGRDGVHLQVNAITDDGLTITLHDWYVTDAVGDVGDEPGENDDAT